jgi:2-dehydropantoate 2-reductase
VVYSLIDATDKPYSYVFVTTKTAPEVITTPDLLRSLLSNPYADRYPRPAYVLVQNGLNVEVDLYGVLIDFNKGTPSIIQYHQRSPLCRGEPLCPKCC